MSGFSRVLLGAGHRVDDPGRAEARFPAAAEAAVRAGVGEVMERWRIGRGDLVVTGGANGADILISEEALRSGAALWLLIAGGNEGEFVDESVAGPEGDWVARYEAIRDRATVRFQPDELGPPAAGEDRYVRNNEWLVAVGRQAVAGGPLLGLAVWDGAPGSVTDDFVARACAAGALVAVVGTGGEPGPEPC